MLTKFVFLHGFGEDQRVWSDFLPLFSWPFEYIVVDYSTWTDCLDIKDYAIKIMSDIAKLRNNESSLKGIQNNDIDFNSINFYLII
jgi:hypothetical protein